MDVWISFYNTHMANNLVKWWRTKFLNGYKQFSADCGDIKVSDTEELLGRYDSEDENFDRIRRCQTSPCQERLSAPPSENDEETSKNEFARHINLEEFFCDVSMDNNGSPGQQKQEFSFTLYDFDGHGKITKDDIAGLVTTIYEALGSSVKVPHCGSKTIKVKLTVSPEQHSTENSKKATEKGKDSNVRYKKDINVTIRQGTKENRSHCKIHSKNRRRHHCCKKEEETQLKHSCCKKQEDETEEQNLGSDDFSDICSRFSSASSSEDECENDQLSDHDHTSQRIKQKKYTKRSNSRYTIPTLFLKDIYNHQQKCTKNKKERSRSSSLQRKELLEIIQANMEKNNLSFQTMGKQCTPHDNPEVKSPSTESKHHLHKHKATAKMESPSSLHHYLANMVEPTQFYVDLASLQNATQLPTNYKYDKLIDAVIGVSNKKNPASVQGKHRKPNKIKTECDNTVEYQLVDCPVNEEGVKTTPKLKRNNEQPNKKYTKKTHGVTGHTSSPHYLKHRNRQEDQARAMAQVVRWLEQEFSSNLTMKDTWEKAQSNNGFNSERESVNSPNTSKNVERHEHHHVHEHIHHHYHHFQETPYVV